VKKIYHFHSLLICLFLVACSGTQTDISADLANAVITIADLPQGYQPLSDENLQMLGMTREQFSASFSAMSMNLKPVSFSTFMNPDPNNLGMFFAMVLYPLSKDDIRSWDNQIQDVEKTATDLAAGMGEGIVLMPRPEYTGIGDGSIGFVTNLEGLKVEIILVRRNDTAMLLMSEFLQTGVDLFSLALKLDQRVEGAYKK